jgi:hypothetical protein
MSASCRVHVFSLNSCYIYLPEQAETLHPMRTPTILLLALTLPLAAQWTSYHDPRTPRKNGQPNLTAPAPRVNGKPDLSGVWHAERSPVSEITGALGTEFANQQVDINDVGKYYINVFWGLKPDEQPLRPEAKAIMKQRGNVEPPTARCLPAGVPGGLFIYAFKMIQTPREIVMLPESGDPPRQIYLDGRSLPVNPQPSWSGYSVAKWQGDTLVVQTTGFNEDSWLDAFGHPRSETMRITESYHRRDFGHTDLEVSIEDPKYYTRQFGFKTQLDLISDADVIEFICAENERDQAHTARP